MYTAHTTKRGFTQHRFCSEPLSTNGVTYRRTVDLPKRRHSRKSGAGFTLIELLVVVSIIGLLSSVVVGSLRTAKNKAIDALVRTEALQLRNLLEFELNTTGSYVAIKTGGERSPDEWYWSADTCDGMSGQYEAQAEQVCSALVKATGPACSQGCVFFASVDADGNGTEDNPQPATKYSITAYQPGMSGAAGEARFLCVGSSGRSTSNVDPDNGFFEPGCWSNP